MEIAGSQGTPEPPSSPMGMVQARSCCAGKGPIGHRGADLKQLCASCILQRPLMEKPERELRQVLGMWWKGKDVLKFSTAHLSVSFQILNLAAPTPQQMISKPQRAALQGEYRWDVGVRDPAPGSCLHVLNQALRSVKKGAQVHLDVCKRDSIY